MFGWLKKKTANPKKALRNALKDSSLPPFPGATMRVLSQLRDPGTPVSEIGTTLQNDPGLSVSLLRTVNSAAFSLRSPVQNVSHAVSLLGRSQVESLVLATSVSQVINNTAKTLDQAAFWRGASRRAATARALADLLHPATAAESFSAALLQDMAIPMIAEAQAEAYAPLLRAWQEDQVDLMALEREAFHWDHAEVASWMCHEWQFPEQLTVSIAGHHPGDSSIPIAPPAISLSADLSDMEADRGREHVIETLACNYSIPKDTAVTLIGRAREEGDALAKAMLE